MDTDDLHHIHAYRAGDPDALQPLIERYRRPLYSFILKMTEGREDADEIFQETWLRVLKHIHRFRHRSFSGWLFRIARNLIIDRSRRKKHTASLQKPLHNAGTESDTLENRLPAPGLNPADQTAGHQLGETIEAAIQTIPPRQREVFLLRMYSGLPFKEIAKIQRCSINTSLARMQYALTHLRSLLEGEYQAIGGNHEM